MAFCTNCGNSVADGVKFCPSCGKEMAPGDVAQPVQTPQQPEAPLAQPVAAITTKEEPITTGGYIGIMLLLMIPALNILFLIIWACGGCNKVNKRNLSRAILVWMLIGAILGGVLFLLGGFLFGDQLDALREFLRELVITFRG